MTVIEQQKSGGIQDNSYWLHGKQASDNFFQNSLIEFHGQPK